MRPSSRRPCRAAAHRAPSVDTGPSGGDLLGRAVCHRTSVLDRRQRGRVATERPRGPAPCHRARSASRLRRPTEQIANPPISEARPSLGAEPPQSPHRAASHIKIRPRSSRKTHFSKHPDAKVYLSQPGLGAVLGARVLAEFGDAKQRYPDAKARRNYAGTSPVTRQSGKKKVVLARHVHNDRLLDALGLQAFAALTSSPGARAYYDQIRGRGAGHRAALRQLGNRLVGILHGCLKTSTLYNEAKAWPNPQDQQAAA